MTKLVAFMHTVRQRHFLVIMCVCVCVCLSPKICICDTPTATLLLHSSLPVISGSKDRQKNGLLSFSVCTLLYQAVFFFKSFTGTHATFVLPFYIYFLHVCGYL